MDRAATTLTMDPINYLPHGPQRLSSHSDPVHGSATSWMADAPWPPHTSVSPLYFTSSQPSRPHSSLDSIHLGLQGALPHPDRSLRGPQSSDALAGLTTAPVHWAPALHSISGLAGVASINQRGLISHPSELAAGRGLGLGLGLGLGPVSGGTGFALQPQGAVNMGPPGATSESQSLHGSLFSPPDRLANAHGQQGASHLPTSHHQPFHFTPPRRSGHSSSPTNLGTHQPHDSSSSHTAPRENTGLPSPVSDRRRQGYSRARRYMGSRQTASDEARDDNEDGSRLTMPESADGTMNRRRSQAVSHTTSWDDAAVRQLQLVRGTTSSKMVASKMALQSLQSVDSQELPPHERTCVICYNDYGVESPEGVNEAPLRLPKCKHVFGDHCIKKWFEDSDSCPYCRDKLPSEPKHSHSSARAFMNMMRMRGMPGLPEQLYSRLMGGSLGDIEFIDAMARQGRLAERRSAPDDAAGEDQRRTRQRRSSPTPATPPSSAPRVRSATQPALSTPSIQVQSLLSGQHARQSHWTAVATQGQADRRAATSTMTYQQGVVPNGPVERTGPLFASSSYQIPPLPTAGSAGAHGRRVGTHQHSQDVQDTADSGTFVSAFGIEVQLPNPLQRHPRATPLGGPASGSISSLRPAPIGNPGPVRSAHQENTAAGPDQVQGAEASSSLFDPIRNRHW